MPVSTPNYLSVAPDGTVSATFDGGLDLLASDTADLDPTDSRAIKWHVQSDGAVVAEVFARAGGTDGFLNSRAISHTPTGAATHISEARSSNDNKTAAINIGSGNQGSPNAQISAVLQDFVTPAYSKTVSLIESSGRSSYFQLPVAKLSGAGRATIAWDGVATQAIVAINLAGAPALANASAFNAVVTPRFLPGDSSGGQFTYSIENFTVNQCVLRVFAMGFVPPAGNTHLSYIIWES